MGKAETLATTHRDEMLADTGVRPGPRSSGAARGQFEGFTRLAGAGLMEIENLVPDPDNIRTTIDPEELDRLTDSVKRHGILAPLRVRWAPDTGKHIIVVGERRYRAACKAGLTQVPVILVEGEISQTDVVESQIAENCLRTDISAIDQAKALRLYMNLTGCTQADLAGFLHLSTATVSRSLSLLELPSDVQDRVTSGAIVPTAAAEIAKLRNPVVARQIAARATGEKAQVAEVTKKVREKRAVRSRGGSVSPQVFKISRGCKVMVYGKRTGAEILAALKAAVAMAEAAVAEQAAEQAEQAEPGEGG